MATTRKVTTYAYDAHGNLSSITNPLGQVTTISSYDANGRPLTIQDPNGLVTTLTYNSRGKVTSKTEAQWVTTFAYDGVGQLIKLTRPDGSFVTSDYDAAHRLIAVTDSLGNYTVYTLDADGNRTSEQTFGASANEDTQAKLTKALEDARKETDKRRIPGVSRRPCDPGAGARRTVLLRCAASSPPRRLPRPRSRTTASISCNSAFGPKAVHGQQDAARLSSVQYGRSGLPVSEQMPKPDNSGLGTRT
jgi:YD repeat-containing protein